MTSTIKYPYAQSNRRSFYEEYQNERHQLSAKGAYQILDAAHSLGDLTSFVEEGVVLFPHTYLRDCGEQIAAVVHACLNSQSDQILAIGVLHPLNDELMRLRSLEKRGLDIRGYSVHGIQGPGIDRSEYWKQEFSLRSFVWLFEHEVKRRGIKPPKLILRYPFLANGQPELLPGIKELENIAQDSIIVATADYVHHGLAYGDSLEDSLCIGNQALSYARSHILDSFEILRTGDYSYFSQHCVQIRNDSVDVCSVLHHLIGPFNAEILDLRLADVSSFFSGQSNPSWVSCGLVSLLPVQL